MIAKLRSIQKQYKEKEGQNIPSLKRKKDTPGVEVASLIKSLTVR